jgi:hypothetical protein
MKTIVHFLILCFLSACSNNSVKDVIIAHEWKSNIIKNLRIVDDTIFYQLVVDDCNDLLTEKYYCSIGKNLLIGNDSFVCNIYDFGKNTLYLNLQNKNKKNVEEYNLFSFKKNGMDFNFKKYDFVNFIITSLGVNFKIEYDPLFLEKTHKRYNSYFLGCVSDSVKFYRHKDAYFVLGINQKLALVLIEDINISRINEIQNELIRSYGKYNFRFENGIITSFSESSRFNNYYDLDIVRRDDSLHYDFVLCNQLMKKYLE